MAAVVVTPQEAFKDSKICLLDKKYDGAGLCGGRGECIKNSCVCDEGFSAGSDFVNTEGLDCPTSDIAILTLWALNLAFVLYISWKCSSVVIARVEVFLQQRRQNSENTLFKNRGLLAVLLLFGIQMPFQLCMAITKLITPNQHVGFDILPTVFFALAKTGFYLAVIAYQPALLSTILKGQRGVERMLHAYNIAVTMNQLVALLAGYLPFITLFVFLTDVSGQIIIARAYYVAHAIALLGNALSAWIVSERVTRALNESASLQANQKGKDKMHDLKRRINSVQSTVVEQGLLQGAFFLTMFSIPILFNKHDYVLPISWLVMPIVAKKCAFAVNMDLYPSKTVLKRFLKKGEKLSTTDNYAASQIQKSHTKEFSSARPTTSALASSKRVTGRTTATFNPTLNKPNYAGSQPNTSDDAAQVASPSFLMVRPNDTQVSSYQDDNNDEDDFKGNNNNNNNNNSTQPAKQEPFQPPIGMNYQQGHVDWRTKLNNIGERVQQGSDKISKAVNSVRPVSIAMSIASKNSSHSSTSSNLQNRPKPPPPPTLKVGNSFNIPSSPRNNIGQFQQNLSPKRNDISRLI